MVIYSHTRLSLYENCPLAYRFRYLDKIKPAVPFIGIEAFMGSCVHDTLEYLYKRRMHTSLDRIDDGELMAYYRNTWDRKMSDDVKIVKEGMTEADYFESGKQILKNYYDRYAPFEEDRTLFVEKRMDFTIDGFRMIGYPDRIARKSDGTYLIHDYKTSGTLPTAEHLKADRQLALYLIGLDQSIPEAAESPKELVYHYLRFGEEFRIRRTGEDIESVKKNVVGLIKTVELASWENNFPAVVGSRCAWCEFLRECPAMKRQTKTGTR